MSIVFSADKLLSHLEKGAIPAPYTLAMRKAGDGTPILGDQSLFDTDALFKTLEVPDGTWTLAIRPESGWTSIVLKPSTMIIFLLVALTALATTNILFRLRR